MEQPSPPQIKLEGLEHHDTDSHSWLGDSGYQTRSPDAKVLRNLAAHSILAHVLPATRISLTKVGQSNARLELDETHKKLRFAVPVMTALQRGLEGRRLLFVPSSLAQVFHPNPYPSMISLHVGHIGFPVRDPL